MDKLQSELIQQLADKQKEELKVTLLEQHLMKARDEYNVLKAEQSESIFKQEQVVAEMYHNISEIRQLNQVITNSIQDECTKIRTDLFDAWQSELRESVTSQVRSAADKAFAESLKIINTQNEIIQNQTENIRSMINGYKIMRYLCYSIIAVAIIVFAAYPLGIFTYDSITSLFNSESYFGAIVLMALAAAILVLSIVLVKKISDIIKKDEKKKR